MKAFFKDKAVTIATAITSAFHGLVSFSFLDEPILREDEILVMAGLLAPFVVSVVMVLRPVRFKEQFYRWFRGMVGGCVLVALQVFVLMLFQSDGGIAMAVLASIFMGLYIGIFASLIFMSIAFAVGAVFNAFQDKPVPEEDLQKIFQ